MTDNMKIEPLDGKEYGRRIMKVSVGFAPAFFIGMAFLGWSGLSTAWRLLGWALLALAAVVEVKRVIANLTHMPCPRCTMELTRQLTEPDFVCIPCNTRWRLTPPQK